MRNIASDRTKRALAAVSALIAIAYAINVWASPAKDVTFELLARGTYDAFQVKSDTSSFEFEAEAKPKIDLVVRKHNYAVGAHTGWHTHPGPVFITVKTGVLTFYEYDDPTCTGKRVPAGYGYVDTGHGHIARNESGYPAEDVTVIVAPVGGSFRGELTAPNPYCGF